VLVTGIQQRRVRGAGELCSDWKVPAGSELFRNVPLGELWLLLVGMSFTVQTHRGWIPVTSTGMRWVK